MTNIKKNFELNSEVKQFNFGDEISSMISKDKDIYNSEAQILKWKQEYNQK